MFDNAHLDEVFARHGMAPYPWEDDAWCGYNDNFEVSVGHEPEADPSLEFCITDVSDRHETRLTLYPGPGTISTVRGTK